MVHNPCAAVPSATPTRRHVTRSMQSVSRQQTSPRPPPSLSLAATPPRSLDSISTPSPRPPPQWRPCPLRRRLPPLPRAPSSRGRGRGGGAPRWRARPLRGRASGRRAAGARAPRGRSRSTPTGPRWRPKSARWRLPRRWCSRERCGSWRSGSGTRPWDGRSSCRAATAPRASRISAPTTSATRSGSCCRWPSSSPSAARCPPSRLLLFLHGPPITGHHLSSSLPSPDSIQASFLLPK